MHSSTSRWPRPCPRACGSMRRRRSFALVRLSATTKTEPHPFARALGDPAAAAPWIEVAQELGDDVGDQRLEQRAPTVLLLVEDAVALDHPAHVAGTVRPQRDFVFCRRRLEHRLHCAEGTDQGASLPASERREHLAHGAARALVERSERLATLRR